MIAVLAVGVLYLNDYQKLKNTEDVIASLDQQEQEPESVTPVNGQASQEKENSAQEEGQTEQEGEAEKARRITARKRRISRGKSKRKKRYLAQRAVSRRLHLPPMRLTPFFREIRSQGSA